MRDMMAVRRDRNDIQDYTNHEYRHTGDGDFVVALLFHAVDPSHEWISEHVCQESKAADNGLVLSPSIKR